MISKRVTFHDLSTYSTTQFKQERGPFPTFTLIRRPRRAAYDRTKIVKRNAL